MGRIATNLVGSDVSELVHGAFKEAGFLADVRRPLKVRYCFHSNSHANQPFSLSFLFSFWHDVSSYTAHFSTHHIVAHNAAAPAPQSAYLFLSPRFRAPQMRPRKASAYGPWTSCGSAKWGAGHRTGHTFGSQGVISDRIRDILDEVSEYQDLL